MLIDAHMHITKKDVENGMLNILEKEDMVGLVSGTDPVNSAFVRQLSENRKHIIPTYGLHPWYADQYKPEDMADYLQSCPIIGEIGMDTVWCDVDPDIQRKIFRLQMDIAQERGCPVVLHTKGQEKEIAKIIADYTMPVIVHWYSSNEDLELYLRRDCYFTVGPDFRKNPAILQVIREVPLNRLFVESDGISAVEWAAGKAIMPGELPSLLLDGMKFISSLKTVELSTVQKEMENNLKYLIGSMDMQR
ncbi:MAG: TatD family hydrolase [Clostridiaceae bacterium]